MARAKNTGNGHLEEALATMLQNQALLMQTQAQSLAQKAETHQRIAAFERESNELKQLATERFARIEAILMEHSRILAEHSRILAEHSRILAEHSRILKALPDAVRDKIGFKAPDQPVATE
jgi:hypothetical protein